MCRYKLATYWQNFTDIYLTRLKILQKVLGGLLFLTHTVCLVCTLSVIIALFSLGLVPFLLLIGPSIVTECTSDDQRLRSFDDAVFCCKLSRIRN